MASGNAAPCRGRVQNARPPHRPHSREFDVFLNPLARAFIEVEAFFGLWLLSGQLARVAWGCAFGFFAVLAAVSGYLGLVGQQSCGCFGRIPVNPWVTFTLDLGAMAALSVYRPSPSPVWQVSPELSKGLRAGLGAIGVLALSAGIFFVTVDNPAAMLAHLRGETISIEPGTSQLGEGAAGEERSFQVLLRNVSNQPVCVLGGTTSCPCTATGDLPITLAPGESRTIQVRMKFGGGAGVFLDQFTLYTNDSYHRRVVGHFAGRIVKPTEEEAQPISVAPKGGDNQKVE